MLTSGHRQVVWLALGTLACGLMVIPARVMATTLPSESHLFVGAARTAVGHRLLIAGAAWWLLYVIAVVALLRAPRVPAAAVGLATSLGIGIAAIGRSAVTSNDLYRYVWDGRVQAAGIDPYRYPPDASALTRLHDGWLWPDPATCAVHLHPSGCTLINRANVHTIYPPLAQVWFLLEHFLVPQSTRDRGYETVGLLIVVATTIVLLTFLHRTGRDIRQVAIWGCCPAAAIEGINNAHVDALAVLAVVIAVWTAEIGAWTWAAAAIGAAGLIKLYPLVLFPAVVQYRRLRGAAVVVAMFAVAYLPHVIAVGRGVTGFLATYVHQQGYTGGRRYQLLHLVGLHGRAAVVVAAVIVVALVALALARALGSPAQAALILFAGLLFAATPGEPWEDLGLVALAAIVGSWEWTALVVVEQAGYVGFIYGGFPKAAEPAAYGIALLVAVSIWALRRSRRGRRTRRPRLPMSGTTAVAN